MRQAVLQDRSDMKKYHHLGIPTSKPQPDETYLEGHKAYCTDHESNPYGIQWVRYEAHPPAKEGRMGERA